MSTLKLTGDIDGDERVLNRVYFSVEISNHEVVEFNEIAFILLIEHLLLRIVQQVFSQIVPQSKQTGKQS
jgi:hypothetical protein